VVNSTEGCQAAARVRKVAAKFQALAVIPQLQALFLIRLVSTSEISASIPNGHQVEKESGFSP
jgi:hypothetical protein